MQEKMTIAQRVTYVLSGGEKITQDAVEEFPLVKIQQKMQSGEMICLKGQASTAMINPEYLAAVLVENKEVEL